MQSSWQAKCYNFSQTHRCAYMWASLYTWANGKHNSPTLNDQKEATRKQNYTPHGLIEDTLEYVVRWMTHSDLRRDQSCSWHRPQQYRTLWHPLQRLSLCDGWRQYAHGGMMTTSDKCNSRGSHLGTGAMSPRWYHSGSVATTEQDISSGTVSAPRIKLWQEHETSSSFLIWLFTLRIVSFQCMLMVSTLPDIQWTLTTTGIAKNALCITDGRTRVAQYAH